MKKLLLSCLVFIVGLVLAMPVGHVAEGPKTVVDQKEVQQALEDNRIEQGEAKDGSKYYYVGKRRKVGGGFHGGNWINFEFKLHTSKQEIYPRQLAFTYDVSGTGTHGMKSALWVIVDNKVWTLSPPLTNKSYALNGGVAFKYSFSIPDSLSQAILATKGTVTLKWKHAFQGEFKDCEYVINEKIVRDIQLMYLGCK